MKIKVIRKFLWIWLMLVAANVPAALGQTVGDFRPGEVLVEIKPGTSIDAVNDRIGTTTIQRIFGTNFYSLATPKSKKENKFRKKLAKDQDVISATLNPVITTPVNVFGRAVIGFPGDHPTTGQLKASYLAQQVVGDLGALQLRSQGRGVIVAVIDTGIDRTHPDIKDHLWTDPGEVPSDNIDNDHDGLIDDVFGWNFLERNPDTMEVRGNPQTSVAGHGTFIAGLIALIAPGAKIMPIRAFSADGVSDAFSVAQGIKYAVDHGASVINLSFGTTEDSAVMHDAISYAHQRGAVLIAAAGNENKADDVAPQFPAKWSLEVMGIAAIDSTNHKASFSNFGSAVSAAAIGVNLFSIFPELNSNPDYAAWSGTSFAAPLASASAALILEDNPARNARGVIENTSVNIDSSNPDFAGKLGRGRIDPLKALQSFDIVTANRSEIDLIPTSVETEAEGKAEVWISGTLQKFEVEAEKLQPRRGYKLVVDGALVVDGTNPADPNAGRANTSNFGAFKIEFSTTLSGNEIALPASLNPVTGIKRVEVRDSTDRIVLSNTFVATPQPGGGGQSVEKEAVLNPTGPIPQAKGKAKAEVESERERLRVEGEGLVSGTAYAVFADGISLGQAIAQSAYIAIELTSDGSSGGLIPLAVRPVTTINVIEVRTLAGTPVLRGSFQPGGDDFGGGESGGETTFQGVIQSLPPGGLMGTWLVAGHMVHVSASTEIRQDKGAAVVGAMVEVRGTTQPDGSTDATRVEVLDSGGGGGGGGGGSETTFQGTIQSRPSGSALGNWTVAAKTVHVFSTTEIREDKGAAVVGAQVEVRGVLQSDGSYNATRIEVLTADTAQETSREATLESTGIDLDARGKITTKASSSRETVEIEGNNLDHSAQYEIIVDGFSLGTIPTDGSGSFKLSLSSDDGTLPEQIRPVSNIQSVTVRDSLSRTVLTGGPPA